MNWLTISPVILLIGIPLLILVGGFLALRLYNAYFMYRLNNPPIFQTSIGTFRLRFPQSEKWYLDLHCGDKTVPLVVQNCNGKPNPALLGSLTQIAQEFPEWERKARADIAVITDEFVLGSINDVSDSPGLSVKLWFYNDEEDPYDCTEIEVWFRDGAIDHWSYLD